MSWSAPSPRSWPRQAQRHADRCRSARPTEECSVLSFGLRVSLEAPSWSRTTPGASTLLAPVRRCLPKRVVQSGKRTVPRSVVAADASALTGALVAATALAVVDGCSMAVGLGALLDPA